ncbi:MAG: PaaI family thioesterase [Burkholderiaceae bacterium]
MVRDNTLETWEREESEVRARLAGPGPLPRDEIIALSGLEIFQGIFDGRFPSPPIGATLNFIPIQVALGFAIFQGRPQPEHYNPLGTVHGGWFCTILDSAMGCAVHSTLRPKKAYTTLELKVNMVRALTQAVSLVRAEAKVIHVGRQVATAEGRIVDAEGKVYGHATTTCMIFEQPSA